MQTYYIYLHINPIKNEPFYVGQGKHGIGSEKYKRAYHLDKRRSKFWWNIYNKYGMRVEIIEDNILEANVNEREIFHIKTIGRRNLGLGPLVNLTDGGEGSKNMKLTDEQRKQIGESRNYPKGKNHANYGKHLLEETKNKIKDKLTGIPFTQERKDRLKEQWNEKGYRSMTGKGHLLKGEKNGMWGKTKSSEQMREIGKLGHDSMKKKNFDLYSDKIKTLFEKGFNKNQIHKELKISYNMVSRILLELNL